LLDLGRLQKFYAKHAPIRTTGGTDDFPIHEASGQRRTVLLSCGYAALVAATVLSVHSTHAADRVAYMAVAGESRAPIGWVEFCAQDPTNARAVPAPARRRAVAPGVARPRADQCLGQHRHQADDRRRSLGLVEKWSYPDDGYGDCEDYVLLKRRMLLQSGWPREALLITVVRDKKDEGHAVLTVKTDRGDYVLDNQAEDVVLWSTPATASSNASRSPTPMCGCRSAIRGGHRHRHRVLNARRFRTRSYATPVTSPPLPVPRPGSRAAGSPQEPAATF